MLDKVVWIIIFLNIFYDDPKMRVGIYMFSFLFADLYVTSMWAKKETKEDYKFNKPKAIFALFLGLFSFYYFIGLSFLIHTHTHTETSTLFWAVYVFFWFSFFSFLILSPTLAYTHTHTVPHNAQWNSATPEITIEKVVGFCLLFIFLFHSFFYEH